VTDASAQDSQAIDNLPDEDDNGEGFYAETAHTGQNRKKWSDKLETKNICTSTSLYFTFKTQRSFGKISRIDFLQISWMIAFLFLKAPLKIVILSHTFNASNLA